MKYPLIKLTYALCLIFSVPLAVILLPRTLWKLWTGCGDMYYEMIYIRKQLDFEPSNVAEFVPKAEQL